MTPHKCAACHRKPATGSKYCVHHLQAYEGLLNHYKAWVKAYGRISMEDFMSRLLSMEETGSWVREVIKIESGSK